jgi:transcriptional regulator with XRE-family HTH domain
MSKRMKSADKALFQQQAGERIRWIREEVGETQARVAEVAGVGQATWQRYESGECMPDPFLLVTFCRKFRVSMDYVFRGTLEGVQRDLALRLYRKHGSLVIGPNDTDLHTDTG